MFLVGWAAAEDAKVASIPDFKLVVEFETTGAEELDTVEMIAHGGRVYQHEADTDEILLFDPANSRIELFDLDRQIQAKIGYERLEKGLATIKTKRLARAEAQEKEGSRANRLNAATNRSLVEPKYMTTFDAATKHVRMVNPVVEIDAYGESETDPKRLALLNDVLLNVIKLGSLRNPQNLPPFTRLDAISAIMVEHKLRPKEISMLFRVQGSVAKFKWRYQLVPTLTARELEALARLDRFRTKAELLTFDEYEKRGQ
jgi:hypothetical protein